MTPGDTGEADGDGDGENDGFDSALPCPTPLNDAPPPMMLRAAFDGGDDADCGRRTAPPFATIVVTPSASTCVCAADGCITIVGRLVGGGNVFTCMRMRGVDSVDPTRLDRGTRARGCEGCGGDNGGESDGNIGSISGASANDRVDDSGWNNAVPDSDGDDDSNSDDENDRNDDDCVDANDADPDPELPLLPFDSSMPLTLCGWRGGK